MTMQQHHISYPDWSAPGPGYLKSPGQTESRTKPLSTYGKSRQLCRVQHYRKLAPECNYDFLPPSKPLHPHEIELAREGISPIQPPVTDWPYWCGWWASIPRLQAPKACTLPTELHPHERPGFSLGSRRAFNRRITLAKSSPGSGPLGLWHDRAAWYIYGSISIPP